MKDFYVAGTIKPALPDYRIEVFTDGISSSKNTHVYLVDPDGKRVGEIPCTHITFEMDAVGPSRITLTAYGAISAMSFLANYVEVQRLLFGDSE